VSAFALTNSAIEMSAELGKDQKRTLEIQRCLEVFRNHLESLPGNARFELLSEDTGTDSLSELRLYDVPEAFQVGGIIARSDAVSIISEEVGDESIRLSLRYDTFGEREDDVVSRYLPLMEGLADVVWRFYSPLDEDWLSEWEEGQGRPRFIELNLIFVDGRDSIRRVFWLPPVVNPRDVIEGMIRANQPPQQQNGQAQQEGQPGQVPGTPQQPLLPNPNPNPNQSIQPNPAGRTNR
ncbi:MAG: hypothetical protein GXP30_08050, partial [Verrucomicrobia bacterium]|nr:hypothetical protein [Verrucomicrobiota bacterium]